MTTNTHMHESLLDFKCLGDKCIDTCCKNWNMQLDTEHLDLYKKEAPELLDSVSEYNDSMIMKRDSNSGYCVKFEDGWCGIHKKYGDKFLGDACNFYPRVSRIFADEQTLMTATMSCPEIARIALLEGKSNTYKEQLIDRLPNTIKNYTHGELNSSQMLEIHNIFMNQANSTDSSADVIIKRIITVSRSLDMLDKNQWCEASNFLFKMADARIIPSENQEHDELKLLMSLAILMNVSKNKISDRLTAVFSDIEDYLGIKFDFSSMSILALRDKKSTALEGNYQDILKNWLKMQLSTASYPFAGLGESLYDKAVIIAVRYATLKLALRASSHYADEDKRIIRPVQSLSRFLDHLASPELSMEIYKANDWILENRINALADI